jgi:hypothetical protein
LKDYHVTYKDFFSSYKAHGKVVDDAMAVHASIFNYEANDGGAGKSKCVKYCFSPFLAVSI